MKPQSLQKCLNLTRPSLNRHQSSKDVIDVDAAPRFKCFSTYVYTTLRLQGPEAIEGWAAIREIDIFRCTLLCLPICYDLHWSLCVVTNPGAIANTSSDTASGEDLLACMIHLDSLRAHNTGYVHENVIEWLNAEWRRRENEKAESNIGDPFTRKTFPAFRPTGKSASFNHAAFYSVTPVT
jgi:Ulp1 family protease